MISGLALAMFAGTAVAQIAAPPPPSAGMKAPPPPSPQNEAGMDEAGPGAPPPCPAARTAVIRRHRRRPRYFRLEHGDTALDVNCADDEPMKACADIALELLDTMQTAPKP